MIFGAAALYYIVVPFIGKGFIRLLRVPKGQAAEYESMLIYSNIGFMGLPVASSVLGPDSVLTCPFLWRCSTFRYSPMVPS